jgi:type IV fimbrial biogenesis protein FimT
VSIAACRLSAPSCVRYAKTAHGFTLVEMMTVLGLLAIMLAIALPGFNSLMERYRVAGKTGALEASLSLARVEALRRGGPVLLQPESGCGAKGMTAWTCGWTVRAGNEILRREQQDASLSVVATANVFEFSAFGQINPFGSFQVSPAGQDSSFNAIRLCVGLSGRMRRQNGSGTCDS